MLTLNQKGQIQRELEGEAKLARLLAPQYLHLLVEGVIARWAPDVHFGIMFSLIIQKQWSIAASAALNFYSLFIYLL